MDEIYVKKDELGYIGKLFTESIVAVDRIIAKLEDLDAELESIKEEYEDFKEQIKDNYEPISSNKMYGVNENEFH